MPTQIGNTQVYSRKEVQRATLLGKNTVLGLFRTGGIEATKNSQGYYQVIHDDLKDYLVNEQEIPKDSVDRIIEFRISNNKLTTAKK